MNKKILAALLAVAMLASLATGCGDKKEDTTGGNTTTGGDTTGGEAGDGLGFHMDPAGYPVMDEPTTVTITGFCTTPEGVGAWETPNELPYFKNHEERTNIHVEWSTHVRESLVEKLPIMFAGDDLPDAFFKTSLSATDAAKYGTDGMLVDLTPYLETYAPDLYALLSERDQLKFMTYAGGIWGFPYYFESEGIRMSKYFMNQTWLENVGMDAPTNWDEIIEVLKAFRDQDANGNGDPTDEVPWGASSTTDPVSGLASEFGMMNRGSSTGWIDADPADASGNTVRYWPASDSMKDLLKMYKEIWDEGLVSSALFDSDYYGAVWSPNMANNWCGMHSSYATVTASYVDDYIALPNAPSEKWNRVSGYLSGLASGMITKECDIPEAMVGWFNYAYTMEGAYEYFLGIEGESYTIDENGVVTLADVITNNPDLPQEQAHLRYSYYSGGGNPGLATDQTFKGGETYWTSLEGCDNFRPATEGLIIWEAFPMTSDQTEALNMVKGDVDAVLNEYIAAFVTGTKDIDADWDEYIAKLNTAGLEQYVGAYQDALNTING